MIYRQIPLTFTYTDGDGKMRPITNITNNEIQLIDVDEMAGTVVYPDNINNGDRVFVNEGNGNYRLGNFFTSSFLTGKIFHKVKVKLRGVDRAEFGEFYLGDWQEVMMSLANLNQNVDGVKTFVKAMKYSTELDFSNVDAKTIVYKKWVEELITYVVQGLATINTNQTITGQKIFTPLQEFTNNIKIPVTEPLYDYNAVSRGWFLLKLAEGNGFVENPRRRRVWTGAQVISNALYPTISQAVSSCNSPSINNRYEILIHGNVSEYIATGSGSLTNYVDYIGTNKQQARILYHHPNNSTPSTYEQNVIANCSLYFGSGVNSPVQTARTYKKLKFVNVDIYAWNDTIFEDCEFEGEIGLFYVAGKVPKFKGNTNVRGNVVCNVNIDYSLWDNEVKGVISENVPNAEALPLRTFPSDPTGNIE